MKVPKKWRRLKWLLVSVGPLLAHAADVYVYPPGCFDDRGRPLQPDPENLSSSIDRACQPPDPALRNVPEARDRLPPLPVPVPERLDTFTR